MEGKVGVDILAGKPHTRINRNKSAKFNRRLMLQAGGVAATTAALMGTGVAVQKGLSALTSLGTEPVTTQKIPEIQPSKQPDALQSLPQNEVFGHLKGKDLETFEFLSAREIKEYRNPLYLPVILRTRQYYSIVNEVLNTIKFTSRFNLNERKVNLQDLFMGLIFAESKGDKDALSPAGALGLSQVMPDTAEKMFKDMQSSGETKKLGITKVDLKDPRTNIIFGLKYFQELMRVYFDPTLATFAYNIGPGNLDKLIIAYSKDIISKISDQGLRQKSEAEMDRILNGINPPGTAQLAEKYGINFCKLMTNEYVLKKLDTFQNFNKEEAMRYVPRVASAARIIKTA